MQRSIHYKGNYDLWSYNFCSNVGNPKKDPVFVTAFRPLSTILVTLMGLVILRDALFLGSIVGTIMIIFGLYTTLWGKRKEKEKKLMENTNFEQGTESKLENQ
ncbi:WAT1-related protein [Vitis vinifera]|uniref:WAT1-related protein n=1 Tax=Vitis vinifera TaxID=29760 RepID=A0A438E4Q2_VITVI|nr:WAT1-related protein [Vitis vinifera]